MSAIYKGVLGHRWIQLLGKVSEDGVGCVCVGVLCDVEEDIAKAVRPQSDPAVWKGKSGWGRVGGCVCVCVFVFRGCAAQHMMFNTTHLYVCEKKKSCS